MLGVITLIAYNIALKQRTHISSSSKINLSFLLSFNFLFIIFILTWSV